MGHHIEKNEKIPNFCIEEWHTSTQCDIFQTHYTCPTVCLLLDTWHRNDHCITVCGKWIFYSSFKVEFPLTQDCLNYKCRGNSTDENNFFVMRAIRGVPPEVVQIRLNIK